MSSLNNTLLSIYVSSTDKCDWLWDGFFFYFNKYWSDCPYDIYFGSETKEYHNGKVKSLTVGQMVPWGELTITNIEKIPSTYILLMLDDFFLEKEVDTNLIEAIASRTQELGAKEVRLSENHLPYGLSLSEVKDGFINISHSKFFRVSLQIGIWEKNFLLSLLRKGETPWEFELYGSKRFFDSDGAYFLKKQPFVIHFGGVAHQGYLERRFAKIMREDGLAIDPSHVMTRRLQVLKILEDLHNDLQLSKIIPKRVKNGVKKNLRRN